MRNSCSIIWYIIIQHSFRKTDFITFPLGTPPLSLCACEQIHNYTTRTHICLKQTILVLIPQQDTPVEKKNLFPAKTTESRQEKKRFKRRFVSFHIYNLLVLHLHQEASTSGLKPTMLDAVPTCEKKDSLLLKLSVRSVPALHYNV